MLKSRLFAAAGAAFILITSACADDARTPESPVALDPVFAQAPGTCDTKSLSAAARDFFPQEYGKASRDLIVALAEACQLDADGMATDEAFDILALMETALGATTLLDPVAGAALATGLLPFMEFDAAGCDPDGCVEAGFAGDILLALSTRGAFGVRGGDDDPIGNVVGRDAVEPQTETDPPVWGLTPSSSWLGVLGQRALLYGHPDAVAGSCDSTTDDCPATNEQYAWQTLPDVDGFVDQMIVGACLVIDDTVISEEFLRMRRNATALEKTAGFDACAAFLPAPVTASLGARLLRFLSPRPQSLLAGSRSTGPGGNASDFSDFTPLSATSDATLVIDAVADGTVGGTIGPIFVTALSANGTPLERVQVVITPEDNNGSWTVEYLPGGTDACGIDCRYTEEEGGTAVFSGLELDKTGGYRICASVKPGGDLGFTFPEKVCSNGFNVRPN